MQFSQVLQSQPVLFYDGPMETRIEYGTSLKLDKEMSIFRLLEFKEGRDALANLYRKDIETIIPYQVPIILNAPTFRASKEHCKRLGIDADLENIYKINKESIEFVRAIRDEYLAFKNIIFITAPIGPKYAGFTPDNIQDIAIEVEYHQEQINAIAEIGVDIISIAAMPGGMESIGAALAASKTNCDYTVGFVLTKAGTLLDGMSVAYLINEIDKSTAHKPLGYIIGCTHPSIAMQALSKNSLEYARIIGIKANGSVKSPKELLKLDKPEADEPNKFAEELLAVGQKRGFKIYGGCCGTDDHHLKAMVELLTN
ncbi:MAG: hypothetical protein A3E87_01495 [Gammaproteobacteria bacterium RIFCSPHIGHO2_12_FULL_35_23]|nr:MAG: hypothetical protein A3E87_01495 [Gammaproteobacteria bacterium RIFCSPHIGHO2_12_FULL_35_23]